MNTFCIDWNAALPSVFVRSIFSIPDPDNSCNTILAVTIGPIPKDIREPKLAPRIVDNDLNWLSAF